jgi:uncharacterized protein (TIGR02271 family)
MENESTTLTITGGMDVVGSDGEKVGDVADMQGDFVVVSKGWFFPTDYYIPTSAITSVDDKVHLNVTRDEALNQGWDVVPDTTATTSGFEEQPIVEPGLHIDNPVDTHDTADDTVDSKKSDTINVALTEEELTARTHGVERGSVQVDKVVTEEAQSLDVPVTDEHVHVTRRIVDREATPGDATFEEGTIDVPVYGEEVEVDKRARVREEIEISKDATTKTERVSDTVRREDVRVTDDSGTIVDDDSTPRQ